MATNLTIRLANRPATLGDAANALGRAGANIDGACGYLDRNGDGILHVLVADAERARRAVLSAGFEINDERPAVVIPIENVPGAMGRRLCQVAAAGVGLDLVYLSANGQLVLIGPDPGAIRDALST